MSATEATPPNAAADCESTAADEVPLDVRLEHFIPLRKSELIRRLVQDTRLHNGDTEQFQQWCRLLSATIHYHYHDWLEELKDLYAPVNPDSITQTAGEQAPPEPSQVTAMFDRFTALLVRANYRRLSRDEINQAIGVASEWGVRLHVDFSVFERLEVYVRGDWLDHRMRRSWRRGYQQEVVDLPIYQRLVVIFKLHNGQPIPDGGKHPSIRMKLFKNIPKADLDMLLPGTRFNMSLFDRGRILLPTITGIAIAVMKIIKGAIIFALAGVYGILALLGFVGGTIGYGVKSFLGYLRTKEKYQLNLTRSLYYQNLDNNAGVICRILDEAEEQELLEAILAYALLLWEAGPTGWTDEELDGRAEEYLSDILKRDVDFEVSDALEKLERFGCAVQNGKQRWVATPVAAALVHLDHAWDNFFRYNNRDVRNEDPHERPS